MQTVGDRIDRAGQSREPDQHRIEALRMIQIRRRQPDQRRGGMPAGRAGDRHRQVLPFGRRIDPALLPEGRIAARVGLQVGGSAGLPRDGVLAGRCRIADGLAVAEIADPTHARPGGEPAVLLIEYDEGQHQRQGDAHQHRDGLLADRVMPAGMPMSRQPDERPPQGGEQQRDDDDQYCRGCRLEPGGHVIKHAPRFELPARQRAHFGGWSPRCARLRSPAGPVRPLSAVLRARRGWGWSRPMRLRPVHCERRSRRRPAACRPAVR
ncbi:hypothetical protein SDC9_96893 [bioreactor metagenome]|uniref:Uncharacterized protein n=1 Tax=bioreactor metagenome TaxID=1076179 RepID=A0A645AAW7_9ZZZZ